LVGAYGEYPTNAATAIVEDTKTIFPLIFFSFINLAPA